MTDQDALIYVRHWMEVDAEAQALRLKYVPAITPGVAGEEGGDVFSIGSAAAYDRRFAIVFAGSVGACEGVGEEIISNQIPGNEAQCLTPIPGDVPLGNNPSVR